MVIVLTMPPRAEDRIVQILAPLWVLPVDIRLAPHDSKLGLRPRSYRWLGDLALLDLFDRPLRARDAMFKRGFDLCLGAVLTTLALPLMGLIALAIRLGQPRPDPVSPTPRGVCRRAVHGAEIPQPAPCAARMRARSCRLRKAMPVSPASAAFCAAVAG